MAVSNEDLLKLVIALTSAFAGWVLAQFTSAIKSWANQRKIRKLLLEELRDIEREIERLLIFLSRQLQIVGAKGIGNSSAAGITNPIYRGYYRDALLSLNQGQRISFQLIHSLADHVNEGIVELKKLTSQLQDEYVNSGATDKIVSGGKMWAAKVKSSYIDCASLQWHIKYHLDNWKGPNLSPFTKSNENYCSYLAQAEDEADKLIESGKTIDLSRFEKTYDADAFKVDS